MAAVITKEQIKEEFLAELTALMRKYDMKVNVNEVCHGWHGYQAEGIEFWCYPKYNTNSDVIREGCEINIGNSFEP